MTDRTVASVDTGDPDTRYTTILIDLDHTLLDSDASEIAAFEHAMDAAGISSPRLHLPAYHRINRAMWSAVERQEMTPDEVRLARFAALVDERRLEADPAQLAETFVAGLGDNGELYPGTRRVLARLAHTTSLALVTNGLSDVQRRRIQRLGLEPYFDAMVISGEVGTAKPGTEIYDIAFAALGSPPRDTALMVGDSLTSDMQGAINYNIAACWYNTAGAAAPVGTTIDHVIASLDELPTVIAHGPVR